MFNQEKQTYKILNIDVLPRKETYTNIKYWCLAKKKKHTKILNIGVQPRKRNIEKYQILVFNKEKETYKNIQYWCSTKKR